MGSHFSERTQGDQIKMNLLPALACLGLVASTFGAPQYNRWNNNYQRSYGSNSYGGYNNQNQGFNNPFQMLFQLAQLMNGFGHGNGFNNFQPSRAINTPNAANFVDGAPLGLTVDFDSSFGSFPLSSQNQLTPAQRQALLPVMESVLRVMVSDKPSVNDVNTLMIQVRDLLKQVPEGYLPNLGQLGFEGLDDLDLDTLKNVALKETGDIAITENGQDKIVTSFGKFPLESLMTKAEKETFLPAVRSFIRLLRKDVLNPTETKQLLDQARKLDSWNLFPFDVRGSNEPRKKVASGTTFNMGALSGLIRGLFNAQNSGNSGRFF